MFPPENKLHNHPLYRTRAEFLDRQGRIKLAYARARTVGRTWNLSLEDILHCSQKFWDMHADPILFYDAGCLNILACHVNLFIGTVAPYADKNPELRRLIQRALDFDVVGGFLLTEIGHGLDILNIETTATKVVDGFILHTPTLDAAKFMPPTTLIHGIAKVVVVLARLIVDGQDCGIRPFVVPISDGVQMYRGIRSALLPPRTGSSPLDYAITTFDHVQLPPSSFLGDDFAVPRNRQAALDRVIWRVRIGVLSLAVASTPWLGLVARIGSLYSHRRHVQGKTEVKFPIITFRTQQLPIMHALAAAYVLKAWLPRAVTTFMDSSLPIPTRHAMAAIYKITVYRLVIEISREVGARFGAQGTFSHNMVSQLEMDTRGAAIAEGDTLALSIRLFSELLLERYKTPGSYDAASRLARHYGRIFSRCQAMMKSYPQNQRDPQFNEFILPQAEKAIVVLGQALAFSAASDAGVPQPLLTLFEARALQHGRSNEFPDLEIEEAKAINELMPRLDQLTGALGLDAYITAPIVSDAAWTEWRNQQKVYEGFAKFEGFDRVVYRAPDGSDPAGLTELNFISTRLVKPAGSEPLGALVVYPRL